VQNENGIARTMLAGRDPAPPLQYGHLDERAADEAHEAAEDVADARDEDDGAARVEGDLHARRVNVEVEVLALERDGVHTVAGLSHGCE
jgi:hypothetical protein